MCACVINRPVFAWFVSDLHGQLVDGLRWVSVCGD